MKLPIRNNLIIELHVPDFNIAKEFYGLLGFEPIMENKATATEPGYLVLRRHDNEGDTILNFYGGNDRVYNQAYFKNFPTDTKRGYATELTIPVAHVDDFYNEIAPKIKDNIKQPVTGKKDGETFWRDFRVEDPFGFYLRFTELIDWGQ
ncbi:MAG: hypothetical protein WC297_01350 [Candidatus Paceibacterota bacterium]|jgi:catechol 2,3-dioxygenase-like lactoylglutathione lyase family enzyme